MARPKRDEILRHEPARKKVTTQRNLKVPARPGDDEETFGGTPQPMQSFALKESTIVSVPRDRAPKGVKDGRGKRSVKDVLMSMPNDAAQATYGMERIASLEDQIAKILELVSPGARAIILNTRTSLKQYWDE